MSTAESSNPYTPPVSIPPDVADYAGRNRIEYQRSIKYVFENPNWMANVLWTVLCSLVASLIPILPALVLIGYQFEILESLLLAPNKTYPDFKVDHIVKYLVRGLYPFLVALICGIVVIPVLLLAIGIPGATMGLIMAAVGDDLAPVVAFVMIPLIVCITIACEIAVGIAIVPFLLRAGLIQDIVPAFDFAFAKDFVRRMWKEELWAALFLLLAALVAQIVGLLMLCVGVFFTVAIVQLAQPHLGMQLYRLYLLRGGEKIPVKPKEATS